VSSWASRTTKVTLVEETVTILVQWPDFTLNGNRRAMDYFSNRLTWAVCLGERLE